MEISARWEDYEIDRRLSEFGTSLAAEVEVTVLCLISFWVIARSEGRLFILLVLWVMSKGWELC
jgi:hypothetical protein